MCMSLGDNIRKLRKEKKMTQQQLADALGVMPAAISKYEQDAVSPTADRLKQIACVLGVDINELLADNESPKKYKAADLFIGSGKVVNTILEEEKKERTIEEYYNRLNKRGQRKATSYVRDLSENPKYKK